MSGFGKSGQNADIPKAPWESHVILWDWRGRRGSQDHKVYIETAPKTDYSDFKLPQSKEPVSPPEAAWGWARLLARRNVALSLHVCGGRVEPDHTPHER
jgi:hypothetical protein